MADRRVQRQLEQDTLLRMRVEEVFPELHLVRQGDRLIARGAIALSDGKRVVDRYEVELEIPSDMTKEIPRLREIGGRIKPEPASHVQPNGEACLFVPDDYWYQHPDGMDIVEFIEGPVTFYLAGQSLVARGEQWPHGDRQHGAEGIAEFYAEFLGTTNKGTIIRFLDMLKAKKLKGHWNCACGSGKRVDGCHLAVLRKLRDRIPRRRFVESQRSLTNGKTV